MTVAQLATTIILLCGVTTKNVDTPKVQDCVDYFVNCVVDQNSNIQIKQLKECTEKWEKDHASTK